MIKVSTGNLKGVSENELEKLLQELQEAISNGDRLVRAVLSGRRRNMQPEHERIDLRPVQLKDGVVIQVSYSDGRQMTAKNFPPAELPFLELARSGYANILIENEGETLSLRISKKGAPLMSRGKNSASRDLSHDRAKKRLLDPSDPFLREVGIADIHGAIKPSKMDKYKQVEEFLRLLVPSLMDAISAGHIHQPNDEKPLRLVDLGCGHAYLTFAAHQYLKNEGIPVLVTGIDIRPASRDRNNAIAKALGIDSSISFLAEEISGTSVTAADIAIALHACDTATDDAIAWALNRDVPLTLFAPCCHHDIQAQMKVSPEPWSLITRHGIMRERLGDLITDSLRIQLMKLAGYRVDAIEFIGGEHTPRNLMIRAVKTGAAPESGEVERYQSMISMWGVTPVLAAKLNR
ncbi:Methyltransferase domain containing protein [Candidatus Nanopelagicaceae bacterium]